MLNKTTSSGARIVGRFAQNKLVLLLSLFSVFACFSIILLILQLRRQLFLPTTLSLIFGLAVVAFAVIYKISETLSQDISISEFFEQSLLEKGYADIIAASITDGIILLVGKEILYVNSVAKKMLGCQQGTFSSYSRHNSLKLNDQNSGMKAVNKAVCSTVPVEFILELGDKKFHYLLQSFSLSSALSEKVEQNVEKDKSMNVLLEGFRPDTLVLAQDVTVLRESQAAKQHLLASLSHEVKTPITSLTMATRLLRRAADQFPDATQRSLIQTCVGDVDRLRELLDDILMVSRTDTFNQQLEFQKIDLGKLLNHSIGFLQPFAKERGVNLTHSIKKHGRQLLLEVDATKIAWALFNVLMNAVKQVPCGGKVEASVEALEDRVEFHVQDNGPGIDRLKQEEIFERASNHGRGLAIARELVMAHGGQIWVKSELNQGAEFCFTLPLRRLTTKNMKAEVIEHPGSQFKERIH